jgi:hypothetical protein
MRLVRVFAAVVLAGVGVTACVKPPPPYPPVTLADLDGSFSGTSTLPGGATCTNPPVNSQAFDAEYAVAGPAKRVQLHIQGCVDPGTETWDRGTFTIDTQVGTIQGTASGSIVGIPLGFDIELELAATSGTGQFKAERGTAHVSIEWTQIARGVTPITGSLTAP